MSSGVKKMGYWIKRAVLWCSVTLVLLFFAGASGLYLLCTYKSDMVCAFVEQELNQITGMQWKLKGELQPHFSPALGISFSNIELSNQIAEDDGSKHHFTARRLRLEPDVLALFQGVFVINKLFIDNPVITLQESAAALAASEPPPAAPPMVSTASQAEEKKTSRQTQAPPEQKTLTANATVMEGASANSTMERTDSGKAENVEGADLLTESEAMAEGLSPLFRQIRRSIKRDVQKRLDRVYLTDGHFTLILATGEAEITFSDINAVFYSRAGKESTLTAKTSLPEYCLESELALTTILPENEPELLLKGSLDLKVVSSLPKSKPVTGNIRSDFSWQKKGNRLAVSDLQFEGAGDRFTANAVFDPRTIRTTGTLHIEKLSFPRWFYFARNLPPGLQHLLHSVSGSTDFIITDTGAQAINLQAKAYDKNLTGSVAVKSFSLPVVEVNIALEKTDLDTIFPFLAASEKKVPDLKEPKFDTPYLIPYQAGGPSSGDVPDVGYSVRVTVPEAIVHSIPGKKVIVSVFPIENDVACVLLSGKEFSGGAISGRLDIDTDIVKMQYVVKNVGLGALPENKNSSVTFDGALSATVDLTVPVKKGHWAEVWSLKGTGSIANLKVTNVPEKWHISSKSAGIGGTGSVHTLRSKGLRLEGLWDLKADGVLSSWNTTKQDAIKASLKGSLAWPAEGNTTASGLYHVYGDLKANGQLILPIGMQQVPVRGDITSPLDWRIDTAIIQFPAMRFKGHGSSVTGNLVIDASQQNTVVTSTASVYLAPRTLLADWSLLPSGFKVPKMLAGKGKLRSDGGKTSFTDLNMMADLATVRGKIECLVVPKNTSDKKSSERVLVSADLAADVINFDHYLPPATPEDLKKNPPTTPWDLSSMQGIDMNIIFNVEKALFRAVNFGRAETKTLMDNGKFSLVVLANDVYGGKATVQVNGILDSIKSTIDLKKGMLLMKAVSLNLAFYALNEGNSYGGMADMVIDVSGLMKCSADLPGALSGAWSIEVRDGLYPAFLGSNTAGLRNTFREVKARGPMEKGVLKTEHFRMTGSMVDMSGSGWVDLGKSMLDLQLKVAMAQGPTIPVRFSGSFSDMVMDVSGSRVVVGTAAAAGVSVFYLFRGILELPARAVLGVGGAFSSDKPITPKVYAPKPAPGDR